MSMVIQVSYSDDKELLQVTERLEDLPLKVSKPLQTGKYKRVYLKTEQKRDKNETVKVPPA